MAFISETLQMRRLTESGVNIKTTYIVDGTLRYRSTDGTCQDDVHSGIRCRKEYFRQGKLLHTEKIFDSRMEYTYVSGMDEEAQHTCENCGFTGKVKEFVNGCPCCDAASNIDYADKELGSKHHYDLVLQSPVYRIITGVVDYIVSFLLCSLWIINTSRTFNGYDVGKIFIYSTILAMILYYFFYLCDAYAVLGPVRRYKEKQNRRQQEFWTATGIDKKRFYNNLNYEAGRRYYSRPDVIDYDIMDYTGLQEHVENGILCVDVELQVRLVYLRGGRITSAYQKDTFSLGHNDRVMTLDSGIHVIKYHKEEAEEGKNYADGKPDYADAFEDNLIFKWDSQIGKDNNSPYMQKVLTAPRKHLLVKKSDAETGFYYMGQFDIVESADSQKEDNNGKMKPIAKVTMKMHHPVREDLLRYLQSNISKENEAV